MIYCLGGSRDLSSAALPVVSRVCAALVRNGSLVVGCASGADAAVLDWSVSSASVASVACFSAFSASGAGSISVSAVAAVAGFASNGGSVAWLAGGSASLPIRARLVARSRAVVLSASAGAVFFLSSAASRGSLAAAAFAASRGLRVVVFCFGFPSSALPALGVGAWAACGGGGVWSSAVVWSSSSLF